VLQEPARGPSAALAKATAAGTQMDIALARAPSAKAAVTSALADGAWTDSNTADATNLTVTGAEPTATIAEVAQLRRQLLVSQQSQAAVEARLAACEAQSSDLQLQLELRQKRQTAVVATAMALGGNALQLQRQLKAAKAKEAAAEARAAAGEHAVLQLKSVGLMDLRKVRSSPSVLIGALAHGVAALRCIF